MNSCWTTNGLQSVNYPNSLATRYGTGFTSWYGFRFRARGDSVRKNSQLICCVLLYCAGLGVASHAQTLTVMASFNPANSGPDSVIQGSDGNFYGTTGFGTFSSGVIFKMTPQGELTTLYDAFAPVIVSNVQYDTGSPNSLTQASDGNFYGTTVGNYEYMSPCPAGRAGSIFRLTPAGVLTTLHTFAGGDVANPLGGLIQASDGNLYGTTQEGGVNAVNGVGRGVVYKISLTGTFTRLYSFAVKDGADPISGLLQGSDGNLYGTTDYGGSGGCTSEALYSGCGTVFKITPAGTLTTLYKFGGTTDGADPTTALIQGNDGNFYGTTSADGQGGFGTIFKITPGGALTTLASFQAIGGTPNTLIQAQGRKFLWSDRGWRRRGMPRQLQRWRHAV
jgi:uncharacterized repeat protein (TIGR03803 family)